MDWEWCILLLEGYGAGPLMVRLIHGYWRDTIMVCRAAGYYCPRPLGEAKKEEKKYMCLDNKNKL